MYVFLHSGNQRGRAVAPPLTSGDVATATGSRGVAEGASFADTAVLEPNYVLAPGTQGIVHTTGGYLTGVGPTVVSALQRVAADGSK